MLTIDYIGNEKIPIDFNCLIHLKMKTFVCKPH